MAGILRTSVRFVRSTSNTGPVWPSGRGDAGTDQAARLAELIRRDPSLLTGDG
ncbi:hypothetical protein [Micromonospora sp. NPDC050200]|uniref:hypothetical protein n=1 Tax=Micromonospora sp. NPDC050200 TaxID=3155664 RepID=UPI0033F13ABB